MIARMQIKETAWDSLLTDENAPDSIKRLLKTGATYRVYEAINPPGFILVDVTGLRSDINDLYDYFPHAHALGFWRWKFNGEVDAESEYKGQEDDILATQPIGSRFEDNNWSHYWCGQGQLKYKTEEPEIMGEDVTP